MGTSANTFDGKKRPPFGVDPLWSVDQLAHFLGLSRKGCYRLIEGHDGPPMLRIGKRAVRFDPAAVREWLSQRQEAR